MVRKRRTCPPRKKQRNARTNGSYVAHRFLQETSLHGLKYIANQHCNCYEKIFWLFAFLAGVSLSLYFVSKVFTSLLSNPLLLTVETTNEPIRSLKFPSVTVCPSQQIIRSRAEALANELKHNLSINALDLLQASILELEFDETEHFPPVLPGANLSHLNSYFRNGSLSYKEVMQFVSPKCSDVIVQCSWKGETNCTLDILSLLTPMGYCCAFNFPKMATGGAKYNSVYKGKGFGVQLITDPTNNDPLRYHFGHKVLVHDPDTYPYRPSFELQVGPGELLNIGLDPVLIESDEDLRTVPIEKRDCNFLNEYKLTLNVSHTYNNCIMDCFSSYQIKQCGCVRIYIQPFLPNAKACGIQEMDCVKQVLRNVTENLTEKCVCRPPCEELVYNAESTLRNITILDMRGRLPEPLPADFQNYSMVRVFFKESRFTKYKRSLRYHWEDFIAAAGGLLGVGFGFSLLSAVEVVYFFCYTFWKSGREKSPKHFAHKEPWSGKFTVNQHFFTVSNHLPCQQGYFR